MNMRAQYYGQQNGSLSLAYGLADSLSLWSEHGLQCLVKLPLPLAFLLPVPSIRGSLPLQALAEWPGFEKRRNCLF
jgi:hypothetical protein